MSSQSNATTSAVAASDEAVPEYSPVPYLMKSGDGDWIGWIQLAPGLYEKICDNVKDENLLIYQKRQALIETLIALQAETAEKIRTDNAVAFEKKTKDYHKVTVDSHGFPSLERAPAGVFYSEEDTSNS